MVSLEAVRENNASLKDYGPDLVAVFGTLPTTISDRWPALRLLTLAR